VSSRTASALVLVILVVGSITILGTNRSGSFAVSFKRMWGLTILCAVAGVFADLAPSVTAPFLGLVGIVYAFQRKGALGTFLHGATAASTTPQGGGNTV
jgi:hypothetical protein